MTVIGTDESEKNSCKAGENVKLKLSGVEEEVCRLHFKIAIPILINFLFVHNILRERDD